MRTIFMQTLWESLHRRVALSLLVVSTLVAAALFMTTFQWDKSTLVVISGRAHIPATGYVTDRLSMLLGITGDLWVLLSIFAVAPLLASHLEKGWAELLFAKGVARWQILTARLAGALFVFLLMLTVLDVAPGTYLALRAGVALKPFLLALLLIVLSFLSCMAVMFLVASTQPNPALLIGAGFLQTILSAVLAQRKDLYGVITWRWVQWLLDWAYRILPKNFELNRSAVGYFARHTAPDWWPVWTTAVFVLVGGAWSFWRFHRRPI